MAERLGPESQDEPAGIRGTFDEAGGLEGGEAAVHGGPREAEFLAQRRGAHRTMAVQGLDEFQAAQEDPHGSRMAGRHLVRRPGGTGNDGSAGIRGGSRCEGVVHGPVIIPPPEARCHLGTHLGRAARAC